MTLTRATLGKLAKRQTKDVTIGDVVARIQKPSPLEYSQYQTSLIGKDGSADISKFADSILLLVARMWIDDSGERLFKDSEIKDLGSIDLEFYQKLSEACQSYAQGGDASKVLGESDQTTASDSPAVSA
jgi:intein/homing endonuclease